MSEFRKDIQKFMKGEVSFEDHQITSPIEEVDVDEVVALRECCLPSEDLVVNKDVADVQKALEGAVGAIVTLPDVRTPDLPATVAVVNNQLADTAKVLGVGVPVAIEVDPTTHELDAVSLESAMGWVSKAVSAFITAVRKSRDRVAISFHRWGDLTVALNRRIAKCYSMIPRRKNPLGDNPIKLKPHFVKGLVLGDALANDFVGDLNKMGEFTLKVTHAYKDYLEKEIGAVSTNVTNAISTLAIPGKVDDTLITERKRLQELGSVKATFLGNINPGYAQTKPHNDIPQVEFVQGIPNPDYVARMLNTVPSLDNERIKNILLGVSRLIDTKVVGIETITDTLDDAITTLQNAIYSLQKSDSTDLSVNAKLAKEEMKVEKVIVETSDSLQSLYNVYYERISCVLAYVEESLMQD